MSERLSSGFVRVAAACAAISTAGAVHGQMVFYVDDDAPGGGDGRLWETAMRDLQDALGASRVRSENIEIRIAGGTYLPSQTQNKYEAFDLAPDGLGSGMTMRIHGGFRGLGAGGNPNDRDLSQFVTILSGDLNGDDEPGFVNYSENSRQIIRMEPFYARRDLTVIDGLTIRGAQRTGIAIHTGSRASIRVSNCILRENAGSTGGAARIGGRFEITNCLFLDNRSSWEGGAIFFLIGSEGSSVVNCDFIGNSAPGTGAVFADNTVPSVRNSIFVDNGWASVAGDVDVKYSILPEARPGEGNLVGDPFFVDFDNGDYRLRADSRCIDAGDTRYARATGPLDLFGQARVVDDPVRPNLGMADYGYIDMGMFEYQGCDGDLNDDGLINSLDLLTFLNRLAEGCR